MTKDKMTLDSDLAHALDIIGDLYDAAASGGDLAPAMRHFAALIDAELLGLRAYQAGRWSTLVGDRLNGIFERDWLGRDPRTPVLRALPANQLYTDEALVSPADLERTAYYNDYVRPNGVDTHNLFARPVDAAGTEYRLNFGRPRAKQKDNSFSVIDLAATRLLLRHLPNILTVRDRLAVPGAPRPTLNLTSMEKALAQALAQGWTLAEFATRNEIATATARWHLSRLLRKIGGRRQSDVVRWMLQRRGP